MEIDQFLKELEAMLPHPRRSITEDWVEFAKQSIDDEPLAEYLDLMFRAFSLVCQNYSPEAVQELYLNMEDSGVLLYSELFWGAMQLQAGCSRFQIAEMASLGAFELGYSIPDIPEEPFALSTLSLYTIRNEGSDSYYLTTQAPENPQILLGALQWGVAETGISYTDAMRRLKRDLTFKPSEYDGAYTHSMVFCRADAEKAQLIETTFGKNTAVAACVELDGQTGVYRIKINESWLQAAHKKDSTLGFCQPLL